VNVRRPWIDWLRALAVFGVMLYHGNAATKGLGLVTSTGWAGVDLFFVLSGFLVAQAWLHKPDLGTFLRRRARRVLPAFWACLVVGLGCAWSMGTPYSLGGVIKEAAGNLLFIGNVLPMVATFQIALGPLWSLASEIQFWLLVPILAPWVLEASKRSKWGTLALLMAVPVVIRGIAFAAIPGMVAPYGCQAEHTMFGPVIYAILPTHMDGLLLGVFLAAVQGEWLPSERVEGAVMLLAPFAMVLGAPFRTYMARPLWLGLFQYTALALGFAAAVTMAWRKTGARPAPPAITWASDRIFSLYLAQAVAGVALGPLVAASREFSTLVQLIVLGIFVVVSIGIGALLYRQVEARFAKPRQQTAPALGLGAATEL